MPSATVVAEMPIVIEPLPPAVARAERQGLEALYYAAFSPPPYAESLAEAEAFGTLVERDSRRAGFDAFVARDASGRIVGLVYGYDTPAEVPGGAGPVPPARGGAGGGAAGPNYPAGAHALAVAGG